MVDRTERIHIRATQATKAHWARFCDALDESKQTDAFEELMFELANRILSGDKIIDDIKDRQKWFENCKNYNYAECAEDRGDCESE